MKSLTTSLTLYVVLATSGAAQAALIDRGGGLIYDTDLNITWLQNANYGAGSTYDDIGNWGSTTDGKMTWANAVAWVSSLSYYDSARNQTLTGWRLPTTDPVNGTTFNYNLSYIGSTDDGFNVSAPGTDYAGSTGSEMAHMFFNEMGNKSSCDPATSTSNLFCATQTGWGLTNTGPFSNLHSDFFYWSGTGYTPNAGQAWGFDFYHGRQNGFDKTLSLYAMAVRDGDVGAVPVPAAAWLFGSGLIGLAGFARKQKPA